MKPQTSPNTPKKRLHKGEYDNLRDAEGEMLDELWPEAIHFENFIPSREERRYIFIVLDRLTEVAPSSANLDITLKLDEDRAFMATVKLDSYPEHCSQTYESGSLYNLMDNLFADMSEHFLNWKKSRNVKVKDDEPPLN